MTLKAADILKEHGIDITVIDVYSIKPIDKEGVAGILKDHEEIFTVEEHSVTGGLGSVICEIACETVPRLVHRIGMFGFAESGEWKQLLHEYKLDGEGIAEQIEGYLNMK